MKLLSLAAAISLSAAMLPSQALAQVIIRIEAPPPPVRVEVAPAPRHGYMWAPGYWNWNGRKHVWAAGHWERARPGYQYEHSRWVQDGGRWRLQRGGWKGGHHDNRQVKHVEKHKSHGHFCPPGQAKKGNC